MLIHKVSHYSSVGGYWS